MDSLTEYTKTVSLLTMRRYKASLQTQEIAQNLENKTVQLDYIARVPVLINLTFRRWKCNFSIYFFFCAAVIGSEFQLVITMLNTIDGKLHAGKLRLTIVGIAVNINHIITAKFQNYVLK